MLRVFVLHLTDPNGDLTLRVFAQRDKARRVARRWTQDKKNASDSEWHGEGDYEHYDADLYNMVVE